MANKKRNKKKRNKTKKARPKKKAAKRKAAARKGAATRRAAKRRRTRGRAEGADIAPFERTGGGSRSGGQSGDLQGLSDRGRASSESVDELLEEGNAFEAEVVKGVEEADDEDADVDEVRTHEVAEDDVPEEYDEDQQA